MGTDIQNTAFTEADFQRFQQHLYSELETLKALLQQPDFGIGPASIGAEVELYIIDREQHPLAINQQLLDGIRDPRLTLELNRYNLEYNLTPHPIKRQAFFAMENELLHCLQTLRHTAKGHQAEIAAVGILPTLRRQDIGPDNMTDRARYHALVQQLVRHRGSLFNIDIHGEESINTSMADVTMEGANTSFQVHYRVNPEQFADTYNAIQLVSPLVVACAANSPILFDHLLWQETRIPLFQQSIDARHEDPWLEAARVSFGHGWLRHGIDELFAESVYLHPPLLPVCSQSDEAETAEPSQLSHLMLHQSTVWQWNRPVYDPAEGGHIRIEMRSLPSGPSVADMVANAALIIGLAEGIRPVINQLLPALPFQLAEKNFYNAAKTGMRANIVWPHLDRSGFRQLSCGDLLLSLLDTAADGLADIGCSSTEIDRYLGIIEQRLLTGRNGASWQVQMVKRLQRYHKRSVANHNMLRLYQQYSQRNWPVAQWPIKP